MRTNRLWYRVATVLVALVIVGTIRSMVPEFLPNESTRSPGSDGVVTLDDMQVELLGTELTRSVIDPGNEVRYDTDDVFVVVGLRVQPTAGRVNPTYRLEDRDGNTYNAFNTAMGHNSGLQAIQPATVGHRTLVFELPESATSGLELVVVNPHLGRVVTMLPVAIFALGDLGEASNDYVVPPDDDRLADG